MNSTNACKIIAELGQKELCPKLRSSNLDNEDQDAASLNGDNVYFGQHSSGHDTTILKSPEPRILQTRMACIEGRLGTVEDKLDRILDLLTHRLPLHHTGVMCKPVNASTPTTTTTLEKEIDSPVKPSNADGTGQSTCVGQGSIGNIKYNNDGKRDASTAASFDVSMDIHQMSSNPPRPDVSESTRRSKGGPMESVCLYVFVCVVCVCARGMGLCSVLV